MTFRLAEAEKAQHPVSLLCSVLGVTRAGYYALRHRGRLGGHWVMPSWRR
jgi:putative transposase